MMQEVKHAGGFSLKMVKSSSSEPMNMLLYLGTGTLQVDSIKNHDI